MNAAGILAGGTPGPNITFIGNTVDGRTGTNKRAMASYDGFIIYCTNNIFLAGSSGALLYASSTETWPGSNNIVNFSNANLAGSIVTNNPIWVSTNTGLYWLAADSPARGAALASAYGAVDFFGTAQTSVADIGAFQYSTNYAADTRTLDPSPAGGADYWTNLTSGGGSTAPTSLKVIGGRATFGRAQM
jgi:hypothetical protein